MEEECARTHAYDFRALITPLTVSICVVVIGTGLEGCVDDLVESGKVLWRNCILQYLPVRDSTRHHRV